MIKATKYGVYVSPAALDPEGLTNLLAEMRTDMGETGLSESEKARRRMSLMSAGKFREALAEDLAAMGSTGREPIGDDTNDPAGHGTIDGDDQ